MKRYIVMELYPIEGNGVTRTGREQVYDADTYEQAEAWVDDQEDPENYEIEDTYTDPSDELLFDDGDDHPWEADDIGW